ncbi:hypothetical protein P4689_27790 [Priestia megaterium]|jgi:hypothetical protein|uniref:hypothetical protein n=1 Tax=Priestia megaterium TaxID=1404 RepID=UPI000BFCB2B8|nr:hypothetical protein [Priestia megaterium]MED4256403.1 hypothetical protein [Priestia megaterium]PGK24996.1 hypothetical protein CN902_24325 [Priestia megaterium]
MLESQPTKQNLINKLDNVLKENMSREQFNQWAYKWVQNLDSRNILSSEEDQLHEYLIFLLCIDLEIEPNIYFHEDIEIQEWIKKITLGVPLT